MNPLHRALIEKTGNEHGFEYVLPSDETCVILASALHPAKVTVSYEAMKFVLSFTAPTYKLLNAELARSFPFLQGNGKAFEAENYDALARLMRRAAELAHALPNQAANDFDTNLQRELAQLPPELKGTEVERLVRQRVGQQAFRSAMLDYWGGACAVTGIALPEILRASHAKPWADCDSDAERLDVFNGFLLSANLDALFDRFFISFRETGELMVSPCIPSEVSAALGLNQSLSLRWLASEHRTYLDYHRERLRGVG